MDENNEKSVSYDRSSMFEPLLRADPSFVPEWERFLDEYRTDGEMPLYIALSGLAHHLIKSLETGRTDRFADIFDVVEHWHLNGDHYVREAATVGLLEDLQNDGLHRNTGSSDFVPWLRPETRRWWDKLNKFWEDGTPLV